MNNLGNKIKELRELNNLSKTELGDLLNVTMETIYKYENNIIKNIPINNIVKLAEIFRISPSYLLGWNDSENIDIELLKLLQQLNSIEQAEIKGMVKQLLKDREKNEDINIGKIG